MICTEKYEGPTYLYNCQPYPCALLFDSYGSLLLYFFRINNYFFDFLLKN